MYLVILQNIINEGSLVESKIENNVNNQNLQTKDSINLQTKELLTQLKNEVIQNPTLQNKNILPLLENLLKMDNLFVKNENLSSLLT